MGELLFSCIGLGEDVKVLTELAQRALREGSPLACDQGFYVRWPMGGSTELWVSLAGSGASAQFVDVNPHVEAAVGMRVQITACLPAETKKGMGGLVVGWADPQPGGPNRGAYPFVFDAPDFGLLKLEPDQTVEVGLAGFARSVEVYADDGESGLPMGALKMAPESFLPSGLFVADGRPTPRAEARLSGHVLAVELRRNDITGLDFWWARVRTLGGEVELVADPSTVKGTAEVGSIVGGDVWLSGRVHAELAAE